jgi:hypothetical protein
VLIVPVHSTRAEKLFASELFETNNVVLISNLVHLGMKQKLRGVPFCRWQHEVRAAKFADETNTAILTCLRQALVMRTHIILGGWTPRFTGMWKHVVVARQLNTDNDAGVEHSFGGVSVGQFRTIFSRVKIVNQEFDNCRIVFGQVDVILCCFL